MTQSLINPTVLEDLRSYRHEFETAKPFRHVVIDQFLRPETAEALLSNFPTVEDPSLLLNEFGVHNPKSSIPDVKSLAPPYVELDEYIQTDEFLQAISEITGIGDLRYDPWYYGAGTHENFHGAGLDAHYDFNIHPRTGQHRRLNAIIYLNKDWDPAWNGDIAFHSDPWDLKNDTRKSIQPEFNRCVIFETTENSWHSVSLIDLPADKRHLSRKSFTIYLYTEQRPAEETAPEHGTVYVQSGLPEHIKAGRTLTAEDVAAIEANLHRRHEYLRAMYKREYQFSRVIESLRSEIQLLKSHSRVPIMGLAKVKRVDAPLYPDGWMGSELRFELELHQSVNRVIANVWLPADVTHGLKLQMQVGRHSTEISAGEGLSTVTLDAECGAGDVLPVALVAERTRRAAGNDLREISFVVDSIVLN